jgi:hypothetical protein
MHRTILAVVLSFSPAQAFAEQSERVIPRVEVGLGASAAIHPHGFDSVSGAQTRVGVGVTQRFGVEAVVGFEGWRFDSNDLEFVYTLQGRYALSPNPSRLAASVTFGATGIMERYRTQDARYRLPTGAEVFVPARTVVNTLPPVAPTVGVAVHYAVTRRIAVRADAQAVLCPYVDAVGTMVSAGVAIPILGRSR